MTQTILYNWTNIFVIMHIYLYPYLFYDSLKIISVYHHLDHSQHRLPGHKEMQKYYLYVSKFESYIFCYDKSSLTSIIIFKKAKVQRKHELVTVLYVQLESTLYNLGLLLYSIYNVSYQIQCINTEQKKTR